MIIKHRTGRPTGRPAGVRSPRPQSRLVASVLAVLAVMIMGVPAIARTAAAFSDSEHVAIQVTAGATQTPTTPSEPAWDADPLALVQPGERVAYGGHIWQARWSVGGGNPPGADGMWGPWAHACPPGQCPEPEKYADPQWSAGLTAIFITSGKETS